MTDVTATTPEPINAFAEAATATLRPGPGQDLLFRDARTHNANGPIEPVGDPTLRRDMYDLMKMAPTSMNMCPARIVFVKSDAAKQRLKPALDIREMWKRP